MGFETGICRLRIYAVLFDLCIFINSLHSTYLLDLFIFSGSTGLCWTLTDFQILDLLLTQSVGLL
jgi:hypothetical protein